MIQIEEYQGNDDFPSLFSLYVDGFEMHYQERKDLFWKTSQEELKKAFELTIQDPDHHVLVMKKDQKIIGYLIYRYRFLATLSIWIDEIVLDKSYRHQGYGTYFMKEIEKIAQEKNCHRIELNCWSFNQEALKFYQKLGYQSQRIVLEKEC